MAFVFKEQGDITDSKIVNEIINSEKQRIENEKTRESNEIKRISLYDEVAAQFDITEKDVQDVIDMVGGSNE